MNFQVCLVNICFLLWLIKITSKYEIYLKPAVRYVQTSGINNYIVKCAICELRIYLLTIKYEYY